MEHDEYFKDLGAAYIAGDRPLARVPFRTSVAPGQYAFKAHRHYCCFYLHPHDRGKVSGTASWEDPQTLLTKIRSSTAWDGKVKIKPSPSLRFPRTCDCVECREAGFLLRTPDFKMTDWSKLVPRDLFSDPFIPEYDPSRFNFHCTWPPVSYDRLHELGTAGAVEPRSFLQRGLEESAASVGTRLHRAIDKALGDEATLALIRPYYPLKCHVEHDRNGKMSMKTHCAIVGARYHPGAQDWILSRDEALRSRSPGPGYVKLLLRREPANEHDPNAVAVRGSLGALGGTVHLGYLSRQDARTVARVMDAGVDVRATYRGGSSVELWWPASTKQGVDEAYRRAMLEGEGV